MRRAAVVACVLAVLAVASTMPFGVDRAEFAYVTQFGAPVARYDGATDAGLQWKLPWPIQSVTRLDRRLQSFDLPPAELPTNDPGRRTVDRMLVGDAYVCWRVPDKEAGERFLRAVGTPERARALVGQRVGGRLSAVVGTMPLKDLIDVADADTAARRLDALRNRLLGADAGGERLDDAVRAAYGVELVDVRLRRLNYPLEVRSAIADRIRSERLEQAARHESEGARRAAEIVSTAEKDARITREKAEARRRSLEADADVAAGKLLAEAQAEDREFYRFLENLRRYQQILGGANDMLLLSGRHELFRDLLGPPPPAREAPK